MYHGALVYSVVFVCVCVCVCACALCIIIIIIMCGCVYVVCTCVYRDIKSIHDVITYQSLIVVQQQKTLTDAVLFWGYPPFLLVEAAALVVVSQ